MFLFLEQGIDRNNERSFCIYIPYTKIRIYYYIEMHARFNNDYLLKRSIQQCYYV